MFTYTLFIYISIYLYFLAAPRFLNIEVKSQNELEAVWSNDDNSGTDIKFLLCWMKDGETIILCNTQTSSETTISRSITSLQSATKYIISVARYSKDGKTVGKKRQTAAVTRSG